MKKDMKNDLLIEIEGLKKIITDQSVLMDMKNKFSNETVLFWKTQLESDEKKNQDRIDFLMGQVLFWSKLSKHNLEQSAFWMEKAGVIISDEKQTKEPGTLIQFKPNVINKKLAIMG